MLETSSSGPVCAVPACHHNIISYLAQQLTHQCVYLTSAAVTALRLLGANSHCIRCDAFLQGFQHLLPAWLHTFSQRSRQHKQQARSSSAAAKAQAHVAAAADSAAGQPEDGKDSIRLHLAAHV